VKNDPSKTEPLEGFDPILSAVDFSFKVNCPSDFDCRKECVCPPAQEPQPDINYLAKDYSSFKQLMLDRMALLMPQWKERNAADAGIAIIELLSYMADHLSYQQDAITTEAYLGTARRRVSVKRHAKLVDYPMHDGCNARTWVHVKVNKDIILPGSTQLLTSVKEQTTIIHPDSPAYDEAISRHPEIFETMHETSLFKNHNEMCFYTWGEENCCLPRKATSATLLGKYQNLKAGDVLIFIEKSGPQQGKPADPAHRHAVRLTHVTISEDPIGGRFRDVSDDTPEDVTEIKWSPEDELPFALCISTPEVAKVSIALGNIVLADHGFTIRKEDDIGTVHDPVLFKTKERERDCTKQYEEEQIPPRFFPHLNEKDLTFVIPYMKKPVFILDLQYQQYFDKKDFTVLRQLFSAHRIKFKNDTFSIQGKENEWSISDGRIAFVIFKEKNGQSKYELKVYELPETANKIMSGNAIKAMNTVNALPAITELKSVLDGNTITWTPGDNLLESAGDANYFAVEMENDGTAYLRFGDNKYGARPLPKSEFYAKYRIGNGVKGNLGAETLKHIVSSDNAILEVSNPLPAKGGVDPESIEEVQHNAPNAFRTQERAVTREDYEMMAKRHPAVQRAAATIRWTGSWHTVFLTVDRLGGLEVDDKFKDEMLNHLEPFRMAGHDIEIDKPRFVSLEIEMLVCVKPDYFKSQVKSALLEIFSNRILPDGRTGMFHPDRFTFGQAVHLSPLYAAAQAVAGVASVRITKFQRQGIKEKTSLYAGSLEIDKLEIARLDHDPNYYQENGVFDLVMEGGK
jgi:hypothetical protein